MATFKELGLNKEIMKSLDELGFVEPTPIQDKTIPFILKSKKDLIAQAQTGTGKTAAFGLPILNQIKANGRDLQAIILCPTRELCIQITKDMKALAKYSKGIDVTAVYGGERMDIQIRSLKKGANIVVGTPGRVHDLIRRKVLKLQDIQWVVLDEADEMLDMGFKNDLDSILEQTPETRRTLLFSATISRSVQSIAKNYMNDVDEISIGTKNIGAENVSHEYYIVGSRDRFDALRRILDHLPGVYGILFCRTKNETQVIAEKLKKANYDTEALHGDVSQSMRTKIMERFRQKHSGLLVATDVAARGIDISNLTHVINYSLPDKDEGYTHRSGRTGRAQQKGISVSIISPREASRIKRLEKTIHKTMEHKQIPSGEEVYLKQIDSFVKEIQKTDIEEFDKKEYFTEITKRLNKISKENLIKYFVSNKFSHLTDDHKNSRDLNAEAGFSESRRKNRDDSNHISLKINLGKNHGFEIKEFFALINSNKKLKSIEIGQIDLMPEYSIFAVDKNFVDEVIQNLKETSFRGKKVNVSISTEKVSGSRQSRGGRSGGRSRNGRSDRSRSGRGGSSGGSRNRRGGSGLRRGGGRRR
ncbi:MAG: DEAD/DEAH box helicase [Patescibacteria group bacterium]